MDRIRQCADESGCTLGNLFEYLSDFCAAMPKPVVMLIDEVDSASDNQVFLDFLALLRGYYLQREEFPTFQSVILAGVYDIRNLKQKLRPESEHKRNSPWNIAAKFDVDMDLEPDGIRGMLAEYEGDWHTGMDIAKMAELLYDEPCGYPFLVSRLCQLMDEKIPMPLTANRTALQTAPGKVPPPGRWEKAAVPPAPAPPAPWRCPNREHSPGCWPGFCVSG